MTAAADRIWAHLHHEMAPEEKERFEQMLQDDPALRAALDERRVTHQALTDLSSEQLLAEWADEHPEFTDSERPGRKTLRFAVPLAAAAALVILLTLPAGPIRWQRTLCGSAPQLRGEAAAQPHYPRAELKQAARELQRAVEAACDHPEKWTLQISIQELTNGLLDVEVSGRPRSNHGSSGVWKKSFQTLETFRENIPRFGKQIADDL